MPAQPLPPPKTMPDGTRRNVPLPSKAASLEKMTRLDFVKLLEASGQLPEGSAAELASKKPRPRLDAQNVAAELGDEVFAEVARKPAASRLVQWDWALDEIGRLRSLVTRYNFRGEETIPLIRELFLAAPGTKAISALLDMLEDAKSGERYRAAVVKADDDGGEEAHRGRSGQKRFAVIEKLLEAGGPKPPWLSAFGDLLDE